jgi:hypothetical protein
MAITVEKLVNIMKVFAFNHANLNTFGYGGYPYKVDTVQDLKYPFMWVTKTKDSNKIGQLNYSFQIAVADRLDSNEKNLLHVQSDCHQICLDFVRYYSRLYGAATDDDLMDTMLQDNFQTAFIEHVLDNETAGCLLTVTFICPMNTSYCEIPQK